MAKQKQHVFSARTTGEGLRRLNELKKKLNVGWDELVIDGMCGHYNLDRAVMSLPKREAPEKEQEKKQPACKRRAARKRIPARASKKPNRANDRNWEALAGRKLAPHIPQ